MPPVLNLIGKRFGKLTVVEFAGIKRNGKKSRSTWKCLCDCGNYTVTIADSLKSGSSKSCGCLTHISRKAPDIVGMVFNNLTVLRRSENSKSNQAMWECRCSCGNLSVVRTTALLKGTIKSCGCLRSRNKIDMVGKRFGRLIVLYESHKNNKHNWWVCVCDCTKQTVVRGDFLRDGRVSSCGCYGLETLSKYRTKHGLSKTKEYLKSMQVRRRESEKSLDSQWSTAMEKSLSEFQPVCILCGNSIKMSTDHVKPLSKGYGLKPGNAVRLCLSCNIAKSNKSLDRLPVENHILLLHNTVHFLYYWNSINGEYNEVISKPYIR
jgi:5-methylcytosine-specific restriction endonuclease McrA